MGPLPPCDAVLIAGPTASGKSALALRVAQAVDGIIVNADSMQVYDALQILSARPCAADMDLVPHLLYGHVSVHERYSLGRYRTDAAAALRKVRDSGRIPIFVGGTGMYFGALTDAIADIPPVPTPVMEQAQTLLTRIGVAGMYDALAKRDPATAATLRASDPQRVLRAYAVLQATGKPLIEWQRETVLPPVLAGLRLARYVLDIPRPLLRERIGVRFEAMLAAGALEEAAALGEIDPTLPAAKMLGLRELIALSQGRMARGEALAAAITATRQFAKRQVTWFRHRMADWTRIAG